MLQSCYSWPLGLVSTYRLVLSYRKWKCEKRWRETFKLVGRIGPGAFNLGFFQHLMCCVYLITLDKIVYM